MQERWGRRGSRKGQGGGGGGGRGECEGRRGSGGGVVSHWAFHTMTVE